MDKCPDCMLWDQVVRRDIQSQLMEVVLALECLDPDYFIKFGDICWERGWNEENFNKCESPSFLTGLANYVEEKMQQRGPDEADIAMVEGQVIEKFHNLSQEVKGFKYHWALRDALYADRRTIIKNPMEGWLYIESDWQETP